VFVRDPYLSQHFQPCDTDSSMTVLHDCPLCEAPTAQANALAGRDAHYYECSQCGQFEIDGLLLLDIVSGEFAARRFIIRGLVRRSNELMGKPLAMLTREPLLEEMARAPVPRNPVALIDKVMLDIANDAKSFRTATRVSTLAFTRYFLQTDLEFVGVLNILAEEDLIRLGGMQGQSHQLTITARGWRHAKELQDAAPSGSQVFVAMRFSEALKPAYDDGIYRGLKEAGYDGVRVDRIMHNGTIDDRIIAEIRRSAFLVADLTDNAHGVYFEAGYALGLGLEAIWTVRSDHLDAAHFDVKQYNMIVWNTPDELRERLRERVRATMPIRDNRIYGPGDL
jgi:hypothetical protein